MTSNYDFSCFHNLYGTSLSRKKRKDTWYAEQVGERGKIRIVSKPINYKGIFGWKNRKVR